MYGQAEAVWPELVTLKPEPPTLPAILSNSHVRVWSSEGSRFGVLGLGLGFRRFRAFGPEFRGCGGPVKC